AILPHDAAVIAVRFTPDSRQLVTFSWEYFEPSGQLSVRHQHVSPSVQTWELTGRRLASWTEPANANAEFLDRVSGKPRGWVLNPAGVMDMSRDGRLVIVTSGGFPGHPPRLIDLERGTVHAELVGHDSEVCAVALSADGRRAATASLDGTARI